MAMGRPSKYTDEILEKAKDYIENFEQYGDVIPNVAGLACELGVARETVHAWCRDEDKEDFSHIVEQMMAKQDRTLQSGGLNGKFNSSISKLLMSKHGHIEEKNVDVTTNGESLNDWHLHVKAPD
jgi:hypothetical protein